MGRRAACRPSTTTTDRRPSRLRSGIGAGAGVGTLVLSLCAGLLTAPPGHAVEYAPWAPFGGYVRDVSIVEDALDPDSGTLTVAIDLCLAPGAPGRRGTEDVYLDWATPIATYEDVLFDNTDELFGYVAMDRESPHRLLEVRSTVGVTDTAEGRDTRAIVSVIVHPEEDISAGGCGTLHVQAVVPSARRDEDRLTLRARDDFGREYLDTIRLPDTDGGTSPDAPHLTGSIDFEGRVLWTARTAAGPSETAVLTLQVPHGCAFSDRPAAWIGERQVPTACEGGVLTASAPDGLADGEALHLQVMNTSSIQYGGTRTLRGTATQDGATEEFSHSVTVTGSSATLDRPWDPSGFGDTCTTDFTDVATSTSFYPSINWLGCEGIAGGYPDGTFGPDRPIRRGEMATIVLGSHLEFAAENVSFHPRPAFQPPARSPFSDMLPRSAHYEAATWLKWRGGVSGYADGTFRPGLPVTRSQAAGMIHGARKYEEFEWYPPERSPFRDLSTTHPAYAAITYLHDRGVIHGYADGTFRPDRHLSRGEAAAFLQRYFD
jgi:hypothetical protein